MLAIRPLTIAHIAASTHVLRIITQDVGMTTGHNGGRQLRLCAIRSFRHCPETGVYISIGKPGRAFDRKLHGCLNLSLTCHSIDVA